MSLLCRIGLHKYQVVQDELPTWGVPAKCRRCGAERTIQP